MTKLNILKILSYIVSLFLLITGCANREHPVSNGAFTLKKEVTTEHFDFDMIQTTGELIVTTMSGPESYYEYQGRPVGLQFALVNHFAQSYGLRVRVELAHSVDEMVRLLREKEVDVICYQLKSSVIADHALLQTDVGNDSLQTAWAVRSDCSALLNALNEWYSKGIVVTIEKSVKEDIAHRYQVHKKIHAPYISKEKGIISVYDGYLKSAALFVGWDWRLLAAQCYQESGFDANAVSWAGAKGLMQIMPAAAAHLNLPIEQIFSPRENVAAAARYLKELDSELQDIKEPGERLKFVLAAYNGGLGHLRDAMALTRKYGHNPKSWSEVSPFIMKLSSEPYYRDDVVKHGYMVGSETFNYVDLILKRWHTYCYMISSTGGTYIKGKSENKENRFTGHTKVYQPDDPDFNKMKE